MMSISENPVRRSDVQKMRGKSLALACKEAEISEQSSMITA
jgi:hypothetical protein